MVMILHPDGEMIASDFPIVEEGPDATTMIDVEGLAYLLYRYRAHTTSGIAFGYVAAPTKPTAAECTRLSCTLFGPDVPGIRSLELVSSKAAGTVSPAAHLTDLAPTGIVLRIACPGGVAEDVFGERTLDAHVLAQFPNAICAYRFLRPSTNSFLPWIPVTMRDMGHIRASLAYRLEVLTGGRQATPTIGLTAATA